MSFLPMNFRTYPQGFAQLLTVGRQKESAFMGRLGALLRPTWQSYAGLPPEEGACVTFYTVRPLERGSMVMDVETIADSN